MNAFLVVLAVTAVILQALRTYWQWKDRRPQSRVGMRPPRHRCPAGDECGRRPA